MRQNLSMKKVFSYLAILGISVILWGCPYRSTVPLSEAIEPVNKQVVGTWYPKHERSKQNPEYYSIEKKDSVHYSIQHFQYNDKDSTYSVKDYTAWTTRIENLLFMNVKNEDKNEYYIHRLDVMGDELMILYQVTSNIDETFDDPEKMKTFFQKHMKLSFFYEKDEVQLFKKK